MGSSLWHPINITWGGEIFTVAVDSEIIFMACFPMEHLGIYANTSFGVVNFQRSLQGNCTVFAESFSHAVV